MPARNFWILLTVAAICSFLAGQGTIRDRIVRYVFNRIANDSLEAIDRTRLYEGALAGMTQVAPDFPYTSWLPMSQKEDYERELQGQIAGIGILNLIKDSRTGEFSFLPLYDTPASRAGLRRGDRIVEVDGLPVSGISIWELVSRLRGEEGTKLCLKLRTRESIAEGTDETRNVEIVRGLFQQSIVSGDRRNEDGTWNFTLEGHPDIGFIRVSQFADATVPEYMKAMDQVVQGSPRGVILDFRGNPGGFLPGAIDICRSVLGPGRTIVTTRYRSGTIKRHYESDMDPKYTMPLVVLVDEGSASASEIVAACLQDNDRAIIAGTRSYGKGTIQELFMLPCDMGLLRLTDASFWRPSGQSLHRKKTSSASDVWGVTPNEGATVLLTDFQRLVAQTTRDIRMSLLPEEAKAALDAQSNDLNRFVTRIRKANTREDRQRILSEFGLTQLETNYEDKISDPNGPPNESDEQNHAEQNHAEQNGGEQSENDRDQGERAAGASKSLLEDSAWSLEGALPWRDPQLDRAIELLQ